MTLGNTLSNICNNGLAAIYKDDLYFVNVYRGEDLYKVCGKMYSQITGDKVKGINIQNDIIYYTTLLGELKSISINGKNEQVILKGPVSEIITTDEYIFYINSLDNYSIYRYCLKTSEIVKISSDVCDKINLINNKLYYIKCSSDLDWYGLGSIYMIDIDGQNKREVLDTRVNCITAEEEYIYYTLEEEDYKLFRINLSSKKTELVVDSKVGSFNIVDDVVYYSNLSDEGKLYKVTLKNMEASKISDDMPENINIAGEYMFFANSAYGYPYRLYKMKLNGEDKQMI